MGKKSIVLILIFVVCQSYSQTNTNLKDINQVWAKFYQAFETLDHTLMAEIHSRNLVRISGGKRIGL